MTFWLIVGVLTLGVLAALLAPLLRKSRASAEAADYDIEVYRSQLTELEQIRTQGRLSDAEAESAAAEIGRRILAAERRLGDQPQDGERSGGGKLGDGLLAAALALAVPAVAFALYLLLGSPDLPDQPFAERETAPAQAMTASDLETAIDRLAARLEANPGDLEGWSLLSRSLMTVERYGEAVEALERATRLPGGEALTGDLALALTLAAGGAVTPKAKELFEAELAQRPGDPRARYYLGLARYQADDLEGAVETWTELAAAAPADAPWRAGVISRVREARDRLGLDPDLGLPEAPAPAPPAEVAGGAGGEGSGDRGSGDRGPTREQMRDAQSMSAEDRQAMIEGMVAQLAARMEENPDDLQGWMKLARSYGTLGKPEAERDALARAAALAPDNVEILSLYARAIRAAAGNRQTEESVKVARQILEIDPENMQALWFVAMATARAGNKQEARALFDHALAKVPEGSPDRADLEARAKEILGEE